MIAFLVIELIALVGLMAHVVREDMADARANGRPVLSLREALRRH